eukprot:PhF_6_TR40575/c0_g1_i1/m.60845/K08155/SLC18A1_2, VMAT; MFS transporter, DHA1 family, solute carrier family 18 (vesicular amine transporter), member 1/2
MDVDPPKLRWGIIASISLGIFCDCSLLTVVVPIVPGLLTEPGESVSTFLLSLFFASKAIAQVFADAFMGLVANKYGPSFVFPCGMFVLASSSLVFAFSIDMNWDAYTLFGVLLCARVIQGFASSAINVAGISLVSTVHHESVRGAALGTTQAGEAIGVLSGSVIGAIFAEYVGKSSPFFFISAIILIDLVCVMFVWSKVKEDIATELGTPEHAHPWRLLRKTRITALIALMFFSTCTIGLLEPITPLRVKHLFGYGSLGQGLVFACATLGYLVCTPTAGHLSDKRDKRVLVLWGVLLVSGGLAGMGFAESVPVYCATLVVIGAGLGFIIAPSNALLAAELDDMGVEQHASGFALLSVAASLGFIVGPLTTSLQHWISFHVLSLLYAIDMFCFGSAALGIIFVSRRDKLDETVAILNYS